MRRRELLGGVAASAVLLGMGRPEQLLLMGGASTSPSLDLNFLSGGLDSRIAFTRASIGTYYDSTGTMQTAASGAARFDFGPTPGGVTNWVSNSTMVGAANPSTAPNLWGTMDGLSAPVSGMTATIVGTGTEAGLSYIEINYAGTCTSSGGQFARFSASTAIASALGQTWTTSYYLKLSSGSLNGATFGVFTGERNSGGSNIANNQTSGIVPTGAALNTQRFSSTYTNASALCQFELGALAVQFTNTAVYNFNVRIGAPQLEQNISASTWVSTSGAAANSGAVPLGLLIEEARTQSIRNSTAAGAVAGTPGTFPTNWSAPTDHGIALNVIGTGTENGINYIDVQFTGTASAAATPTVYFDAQTGIAAVTGQTWTVSTYTRLVAGSNTVAAQIGFGEFSSAPAFLASHNTTVSVPSSSPLATQRQTTAIATNQATCATIQPFLFFSIGNGAVVNFTLRIGLPQLELGAFATSAVPTSSVAVARVVDRATMPIGPWYSTTSGSVVVGAVKGVTNANSGLFEFDDGTLNNRWNGFITAGAALQLGMTIAASAVSVNSGNTVQNGSAFKGGATWGTSINGDLNGSTVVNSVQPSGALSGLTTLHIGELTSFAQANGWISRLRYWPRVLANSELIAATSGDAPSLDLDFVNSTTLDPRITFTRASAGTYFDATGTLQSASTNVARYDYGATPGGVTNWLRNSTMVNSGGIPTNWASETDNAAGYTATYAYGVENGLNYVDVTLSGTPASATYFLLYTDSKTALNIPYAANQTWTHAVNLRLSGGSLTNISGVILGERISDRTGAFVSNPQITVPLTSSSTRYSATGSSASVSAAYVTGVVQLLLSAGNPIQVTLRISAPQLEQSAAASAFVPTSGTAANSGALPKGLLIEEARTNSIRNNTMVGAVVGTPGTYPTNWSESHNTGIAPSVIGFGTENGIAYVDLRFNGTTAGGANNNVFFDNNVVAATPSQVWTSSFYMRVVGGSTTNITAMYILYGDNIASIQTNIGFPTSAALATQRFVTTWTANAGAVTQLNQRGFQIVPNAAPVAIDITLRVGLPQWETGAFATSAIQTSSVAVTRAGDVANMSADTSWFSGGFAPGTMGVEYLPEFAGTVATSVHALTISDAGTTNRYCLRSKAGATATAASLIVSGGGAVGSGTLLTDVVGTVSKLAMAWSGGAVQNSVGNAGTVQATTAAAPVATLTTVGIGNLGSGFFSCGWTRRTRYWPRMMPNTELQSVTT